MQLEPMTPMLKAPGIMRLNTNFDKLHSRSAFNFNLRHYAEAEMLMNAAAGNTLPDIKVAMGGLGPEDLPRAGAGPGAEDVKEQEQPPKKSSVRSDRRGPSPPPAARRPLTCEHGAWSGAFAERLAGGMLRTSTRPTLSLLLLFLLHASV